ncbi:MAG: hypothetical protein IKZ52_09745 [Bacteroidales bacterium]|nr:hypothetical protein [Bacteroidales bacterium]
MKEVYNNERRRGLITVLSIIAVLLIGVGIFFYYNFFRQTKSELIEAVPTDAVFMFEVNDNATFVQDISPLLPYFNELFAMDALPAFESVHNALPANQYDITISGHPIDNSTALLFNTHIDKASFKRLLKALSIDPANCESFEQQKIYTYGTDFKKLHFVFVNHILSISTNMDLLKKSIIQHRHPKNLFSIGDFKKLYDLAEKNKKHNWLFINAAYTDGLCNYFTQKTSDNIQAFKSMATWAAFQIRFSSNEVLLSGYISSSAKILERFTGVNANNTIPEEFLPYHANQYYKLELPEYDLCYFTMPQDTNQDVPFMSVRRDSVGHAYSPFMNEHQMEDLMAAYPNGIFPVTDSTVLPKGSIFDTVHYKVFAVKGDHYLFAPTTEDILMYSQDIASNGSISNNRYYKFAKGNIASSNIMEFTYYNPMEKKSLRSKLSDKGKTSHFGQDLFIFSLSCNNITDEFASVNIYLNFVK